MRKTENGIQDTSHCDKPHDNPQDKVTKPHSTTTIPLTNLTMTSPPTPETNYDKITNKPVLCFQ